jgi:hypothetical protein
MRKPHDDDPSDPMVELDLYAVPDAMTLADYHDRCLLVAMYSRVVDRLFKGPRDTVDLGVA